MKQLYKIGCLLYGIGIIAVGIHQIIIRDFRPEILPPFPAWAHSNALFPVLTGILMIIAGFLIAGFRVKNVCIFLGVFFLFLIVTCQLPYIFFMNPVKLSHLEVWFGAGEELAYCGGALAIAGSSSGNLGVMAIAGSSSAKLSAIGRIFFAILIVLFGCSHFVFPDAVSTMVPKWLGVPFFWTYFVGAVLIIVGLAILFKIWVRSAAFVLAAMLMLFFLFFHLPDAINNPLEGKGNEIVRAIIALQFCGTALVIGVNKS